MLLASKYTAIASLSYRMTRMIAIPSKQGAKLLSYNRRKKSTLALSINANTDKNTVASKIPNLIPDFNDARSAYENKSTKELLRAVACFQCCKFPLLVENAENLLIVSRKIFGGRIVDAVLKATIYSHFCAGEDQQQILPAIQQLANSGVGSILDYAAENDGTVDGVIIGDTEDPHTIVTVREYDYESEAKCDNHVSAFIKCINDVARMGGEHTGFAAVKITALGNPKLLARLSTAIVEAKWLFADFDSNGNGLVSRKSFELGYNHHFIDGDVRIQEIFEEFDPNKTGYIDYITWSMMLSPLDLPKVIKSCKYAGRLADACPTDEEIKLLNAMYNRGRKLGKEASKCGVRLLIDAEQVRYQPAIDNLVLELQRQFNVGDKPIIYNTYQCYLKDSSARLRTDVARSERFKYNFGAKIVRGAYMESERDLAASLFLDDPIHSTIEDTHNCYNNSVDYLLCHSTKSDLNVEVMCATHNQTSIVHAIASMNLYEIDRSVDTICFAQLYGMSDKLVGNYI